MQTTGPETHPRVTIIIVTWNGLALLKRFLASVVSAAYPNQEIILADNASTDGSAEWVQRAFPEVRVIRYPENYGFCRGNNLAIEQASGDFVALLNNDVEVLPGWLDPLVKRLVDDPDVAAVQPKVLKAEPRNRFEYAGASGGFLDRWGYPFARGRIFFDLEVDSGQYDTPCDVFWATGAAVVFRRAALEQVGLLDENFYMHMEEIDLCWRLIRAGWRIVCEPAGVVYHVGAASLSEASPRKAYFNYRNNLLTLYKNLPPGRWRIVYATRTALDTAAVLRSLVSGRPAEAMAIWRARRDAVRMQEHYRNSRPTEYVAGPTYQGSIVVDYFLRRRRRFSDLPASKFGRSTLPVGRT